MNAIAIDPDGRHLAEWRGLEPVWYAEFDGVQHAKYSMPLLNEEPVTVASLKIEFMPGAWRDVPLDPWQRMAVAQPGTVNYVTWSITIR